MNKRVFLLIFSFIFLVSSGLNAEEAHFSGLSPSERILVVAPHPDDETIGAGGFIQEALKRELPVKVVYITHGDSNPLSYLYYKKHPAFTGRQAIEFGKLRQKESIEAARHLGLDDDQLVHLGYPDYGTLKMFKNYWITKKLYRGAMTKVLRVPYDGVLTPGAPHQAQSLLEDLKKVLLDFQPTIVFVTHPADLNDDHQAAYLFVKIALWELKAQLEDIRVYAYFVHAINWPHPVGYFPDLKMEYDPQLNFKDSQWGNYELTAGQIERKRSTIGFYRTQIPYKPNFLYSFVRLNEPFAQIAETQLKAGSLSKEAWGQLEEQQATCLSGGCVSDRHARYLKSVVYGLAKDSLNIRARLNQPAKGFKIDMSIFGFRQDVVFSQMPKVHIEIDRELNTFVRDGREYRRNSGVNVSRIGNDFFVSVPLILLGFPEKVIASASVRANQLPIESSSWISLGLDHDP